MHFWAGMAISLLGLVTFSFSADGADIRLKSGAKYESVKILRKNGTKLEVMTAFGKIDLPLENIESIDGKPYPVTAAAPTSPPEAPTVSPATSAPTAPTPELSPQATPELPRPAPEAGTPDNTAPNEVEPARPPQPIAVAPSGSPPGETYRAYIHDPKMDWLLAGMLGSILLCLVQLVCVQAHLNQRGRPAGYWNLIVLILPGAGLLAYLASAIFGKKHLSPRDRNPDLAKAAAKRGIFHRNSAVEKAKGQGIGLKFIDEKNQSVPMSRVGKEHSGLDSAREVLEAAVIQRASDIHIEPQAEDCRVRFRVDGQLAEHTVFGPDAGKRLVTALKSLGGIDIAEKRKAQDGRFRVRTDLRDVDFRVATASAIHGEKVVIRILDRKGGLFTLDEVGMAAEMEAIFDQTIHSRSGMIIVTGPTGSGKTSTLYAALSRLDRTKLNIMTIEDPVEYELEGATQIPVAPKAGTTYESGLRSILRQDPDVILVGEMRDAEAATVAIRAALTGHLVFTSLHTRDSIATLIRLEEMGMDRSQLSSALLMLVAQRLVRTLCPSCRKAVVSTGEELLEIGIQIPVGETIYEPGGCEKCEGSGFYGRTAVFELLVMTDEIRQAVNRGAEQDEILVLARKNGFLPYREDGASKVLRGITSVAEVLEAT